MRLTRAEECAEEAQKEGSQTDQYRANPQDDSIQTIIVNVGTV